ncbi:MAG: hypothetical protein PHY99_07120, partial [Bacteroidales bacterium]|nr:hypothetical protein [Bacteroidales bacterium]
MGLKIFKTVCWCFSFAVVLPVNAKDHRIKSSGSQNLDIKGLAAGCTPGKTRTMLDLNNVRTYIWTNGVLWNVSDEPNYEVPKNSQKSSMCSGGIWIGGTDVNGQLKLSAIKYQGDVNYWPGPLVVEGEARGTTDVETCFAYDKHFAITRYQVDAFRSWYNADEATREKEFKGYTIPDIIMNWPAHGDAAAGYAFNLAPFWDNNDDGVYNPADGDYPFYDLDGALPCGTTRELRRPRLYGDQTNWWIYNDRGNIHQLPNGEAIGMEIHGQGFEFSTNDAMNDMTFYNYALINRSTYTLIETYFGVYADSDLGYYGDDYVGCHVSNGLGYTYNGDAIDGTGQILAYGANPPAIGIDFFEGPY